MMRQERIPIALISASMLAFEITLTRLFAIQQFHHFGFLVISLAVLGISVSGVLLTYDRLHVPTSILAFIYSASVIVAYLFINLVSFDSYSIAWDRSEILTLLLYFLVAGAPFVFAGWVIGTGLSAAGQEAHIPYAANLIGSAAGCLVAVVLHAAGGVMLAICASAGLGLMAGMFATRVKWRQAAFGLATGVILAVGLIRPPEYEPRLSPYKPLSVFEQLPDARRLFQEWTYSSRMDLIETSAFHSFPGLSLNHSTHLPSQSALFLDGDGPLPMTWMDPATPAARELAESMPSAIAYQLRPDADALILQPGVGLNGMLALALEAGSVDLAQADPGLRRIMQENFHNDALLETRTANGIHILDASTRSAIANRDRSYNVIEFALTDPYRPVASGAFSLTENFDFTTEAIQSSFERLSPDGLLMITRWLGTPPSEAARAWATLLAGIQAAGIQEPGQHVIAFRGMRTATMIANSRPFTSTELSAIRVFLNQNSFDPIYLPDLEETEVNRSNVLPEPVYHRLFTQLLNDPETTIQDYPFNLRPPTDNRPYFFHFFRWRQTPDVLATLGMTWQPFGGSGYLVLITALLLMLILAVALVALPYVLHRKRGTGALPGKEVLFFFSGLGAGYLLVEVALIQRFTQFLDKPVYSLVLVISILLVASGVGSLYSKRIPLISALSAVLLAIFALMILLSVVDDSCMAWSLPVRFAFSGLVLLPLGFLMGIPFASGLRKIDTQERGLIAWAWAVNGAASGLSGVLAAIISIDYGFIAVLGVGALSYAVALLSATLWETDRRHRTNPSAEGVGRTAS